MLKKIALVGFFALSTAFLTASAVSAHTAAVKVPVPTAPHGFCMPYGWPC